MTSRARYVLPLLLVLLAGCVRYEEHIEIDENGKGKATLIFNRPKRGFIEKAMFRGRSLDALFEREYLEKDLPQGVKLADHTMTEKDERVDIRAVYTFDDVNKLLGWAARKDFEHPLNNVSVRREGKTLEFTRRFDALDKERMEAVKKYAPDVVFTFKLTGPGVLKANNATKTDGATATWEIKAVELFEGGKSFNATYFYGISPILLALFGVAGLAGVVVVLKLMKKKPAAPPAA